VQDGDCWRISKTAGNHRLGVFADYATSNNTHTGNAHSSCVDGKGGAQRRRGAAPFYHQHVTEHRRQRQRPTQVWPGAAAPGPCRRSETFGGVENEDEQTWCQTNAAPHVSSPGLAITNGLQLHTKGTRNQTSTRYATQSESTGHSGQRERAAAGAGKGAVGTRRPSSLGAQWRRTAWCVATHDAGPTLIVTAPGHRSPAFRRRPSSLSTSR
jgi:hypothetical protein